MKSVAVLLIFSFLSPSLFSQCISGNCFNGTGKYRLKDKSIYSGQFKNNLFHGQGKLQFVNGDIYTGGFIKGKKNNLGKYKFKDNSFYIGDYHNDEREGKGKMRFQNGEIYKGEWIKGLIHGKGEYQFKDGSSYKGEFAHGKLNGNGVLTTATGKVVKGMWKNNEYLASSDTTDKQSAGYSDYKNCTSTYCHQEEGAYYYKDGSVYFGYFLNGNPEGEGRCEYINGDVYVGDWKNHSPHGEGIMHLNNDQKISGVFQFGQLKKRTYTDITKSTPSVKRKSSNNKVVFENGSKIYAVIVGIASYNHMKSLKYTDDDAYQLYAFLKSPQGGAIPDDQITVLIDDGATKSKIKNTMENVFGKADEDDVIILYLSGHGLNGAFVPSDFDGTHNLLLYDSILSIINSSKAKNKLCITDACHSGSMYASRGTMNENLQNYYTEINQSLGGVAMMTSSKEDEVSLEYSGIRQGVFSHFLIRGMKGEANLNNDNLVTVGELFQFVYNNVTHYTNGAQTPAIQGNYTKEMPVAMIYEN